MNCCYKVNISGKVQGVFFRSSSQQKAIEYSLSGYACNLANGGVEVLLCGEQKNIDHMLEWLAQGPEQAEVESVEYEPIGWQEHNFFSIN